MAGIALVLDLIRKNPSWNGRTFHSNGLFSATLAASAAAASVAAGTPFASRAIFGIGVRSVAHCDTAPPLTEDYLSSIRTASGTIIHHNSFKYSTKEYYIELKPLFSAFQWKNFGLTTLRSFLLYYLPLLGPRVDIDEDDDDFLQESLEEHHLDLVTPFKKSVKQIVRETSVVTTRRVLERLAVHYFSQRVAWKLLKDLPKSAVRKANRGVPTAVYFYGVSKSTFRGHFLGVAASWIVQVIIESYRFISGISNSSEDDESIDRAERIQVLGKKVIGITVRCSSSLVFASVGAGIGATVFRPSSGQSFGCLLGDLAGPVIVSYVFEKMHMEY